MPGYPAVKAAFGEANEVFAVDDLFGGRARVLAAKVGGLDLFVLDAPHLFGRQGNPYVTDDGRDWPDNAFRFGRARMDRRAYPAFIRRGLRAGYSARP